MPAKNKITNSYDGTPLNVAFIEKVADTIEAAAKAHKGFFGISGPKGVGFNMATYISDGQKDHVDSCGTTACIAGTAHIVLLNEGKKASAPIKFPGTFSSSHNVAREAMNLSQGQADKLFAVGYGKRGRAGIPEYTLEAVQPLHAVAVLRHLAKTGKIDGTKGETHTLKALAKVQANLDKARAAALKAQDAEGEAVELANAFGIHTY